ncbi:MAG: hypothetical protein OHK0022_00200 [Roseiflexaceae bacterium]
MLASSLVFSERLVAAVLGVLLVVATLRSAIQTVILPRSARDKIARLVFLAVRAIFDLRTRKTTTYEQRDRIMAAYAPVALLTLLISWLVLIGFGYTLLFWAWEQDTFGKAVRLSGSSLLTLGFETVSDWPGTLLAFSEATMGLILVAVLIGYLPTMYAAFSRREAVVSMLEVRAGSPPSAVQMIIRFNRLNRMGLMHDLWISWEQWFVDLAETHTSLAALSFFRSPHPAHSWVTAAGAVLDAAALVRSTVDTPSDEQADLCLRAGYLSLRQIASTFQIHYEPDPVFPEHPISISRFEFDQAYEEMRAAGVPLVADREQAWHDFAGWRVNYDTVLIALATLTMAPYAPWSSDRSLSPRRQQQLRRLPLPLATTDLGLGLLAETHAPEQGGHAGKGTSV